MIVILLHVVIWDDFLHCCAYFYFSLTTCLCTVSVYRQLSNGSQNWFLDEYHGLYEFDLADEEIIECHGGFDELRYRMLVISSNYFF